MAYADGKYTDESWLREQYREKALSQKEIADKTEVTQATISKWVQKFGIKRRWQDSDLLEEMYADQQMTLEEMAEEFECGRSAITQNLREGDVEIQSRRDYGSLPKLKFRRDGHVHIEENDGDKTYQVQLHRLIAVAEYGLDALDGGKIVHHKNCIPWDNRPSNLLPMKRDEHTILHDNPRQLRSLDPEWSQYQFHR